MVKAIPINFWKLEWGQLITEYFTTAFFNEKIYFKDFGLVQSMNLHVVVYRRAQDGMTGTVKVKIYKGGVYVLGRSSPMSLYNEELVRYVYVIDNEKYSSVMFVCLFDGV